MKKKNLPLNRNGTLNNATLNAGQVAMTTGPTGYAMFSDLFFFFFTIYAQEGCRAHALHSRLSKENYISKKVACHQ